MQAIRLLFIGVVLVVVGCGNATREQIANQNGGHTDIYRWSHDDDDGEDSAYALFDSASFRPFNDGVLVEIPDCERGQTIVAHFAGRVIGSFEYRASLRMFGREGSNAFPVHGAQIYLEPSATVFPVNMLGAFSVNDSGPCSVGVEGKVFTGTLTLQGAATLVVERHHSK